MLGENSLKLSQDSGAVDQYIYSIRMKVKQFHSQTTRFIYFDLSNADAVSV